MGTGIGHWFSWQSMKAIFVDITKLSAFIEYDGVFGSWSRVALIAACDKA